MLAAAVDMTFFVFLGLGSSGSSTIGTSSATSEVVFLLDEALLVEGFFNRHLFGSFKGFFRGVFGGFCGGFWRWSRSCFCRLRGSGGTSRTTCSGSANRAEICLRRERLESTSGSPLTGFGTLNGFGLDNFDGGV